MTDHIPDIILERYRLNELPAADAAAVAAHLERDSGLRARLAALEASDAALRAHVESIARGLTPAVVQRRTPALVWGPVAAVAAIAVVFAVVARTGPANAPAAPTERVKGADENRPALALYRRTADGSERLADGASARAGDVVRVGYHAAGRAYGAIVSVDGRGTVTAHLPVRGDAAVELRPEATVLLDQAYELDDAPRWERFYFVTGDTSFDLEPLLQAARDAPSRLALPNGLAQSTFTLQKESAR
jgi:hypothetical protein